MRNTTCKGVAKVKDKLISAEALLHAVRDDISINGTNFARVKQHIENAPAVVTDNNVGSKWIPVTERLPEQEMEVIVYTGNILKPSVHCYHFWTADLLSWQSVTHWMPLPEAPKGE